MDKNKIGLGKGLSAILGEIEEETSQVSALIEKKDVSGITFLPLESLQPGKFQPRRVFTKDILDDLVASIKTIERVKKNFNPDLDLHGILLTMFDGRSRLSYSVAEDVRRFFGSKVYEAFIPRNVRIPEAPSH